MQKRISFFKESIKSLKTTGTVMPSSRFLVKKMLSHIDFSTAKVIVEFGPGNGIITQQLLKEMKLDCSLVCFEINTPFYEYLKEINDNRLTVLNTSAELVLKELNNMGFSEIDYIISSLPLAIIPNIVTDKILNNSKLILKEKGIFIQYQYSLGFYKKFKKIFKKKNVFLDFEFVNIPPAFIYKCINESMIETNNN